MLTYHYSNVENGMTLRRYWSTAACAACPIKRQCTPSKERRITRWEREHVVEEVQRRLDANPDAMRTRRETVEHPFGTIKARMGATHFLMKRLHNVPCLPMYGHGCSSAFAASAIVLTTVALRSR